MGFPHLSDIQRKYADAGLKVIGVTTEDPGNSLSSVKKFVSEQGSKMDFTVAFTKSTKAARDYEVRGLPSCCLIDREGKIAWMGHPADPELGDLLEEMTSGSYDPVASAKKMRMVKRYKELLELDAHGRALKLIDQIIELDASKKDYYEVDRFHCLVKNRKTRKEALERGPQIVAKVNDARMLARMAWRMLTEEEGYKGQYDDLALEAAEKAYRAQPGDWTVLRALAYAKYLAGDKRAAVELQTKAIEASGRDEQEKLRKDLEWFKS